MTAIQFTQPKPEQGAQMWELVKETKVLDLNTPYLYLLLARDFQESSLVALQGDEVVGLITGYFLKDSSSYFLWQVGVHPKAQGQGLASQMMDALFAQSHFKNVTQLETTITASNKASRRLFEKFANRYSASMQWESGFVSEDFPTPHEQEERLIIKNIQTESVKLSA